MISALTWLTSAESKIAELDSAVDAAEEHPDLTSLKEELKVRTSVFKTRRKFFYFLGLQKYMKIFLVHNGVLIV